MAYDEKKDVLIKLIEMKQGDSSLHFSIFTYDSGEAKLQISRMFQKKDGTASYSKVGRLTKDEIKFFLDHSEEILELINNFESSR